MYYIKNVYQNQIRFYYALFILIAYVGGFIGVQANTITKSLNMIIPFPSFLVGVI